MCPAYTRRLGAKTIVKNRMIPCLEEGFTDRHQSVQGSNCWTHHLDMAAA